MKDQTPNFDNKDKEILNILQENYRISYKELSKEVGLAPSTIHNRVQNMVKNGIIREFDTVVCPLKVGYESVAILGLSVEPMRIDEIAEKISSFNEVQLVATSTGDHDIIVQVYSRDDKVLWRFINQKIKTIEGVRPRMDVSSFIDIFKMTYKINFKINK